MTYWILDHETEMVVPHSAIRAKPPADPNLRIFPHGVKEADVANCEDPKPTNLRTHEDVLLLTVYPHDKLPSFNPEDLIGAPT